MLKTRFCGLLAFVIALESLAPACWANDSLGDSFRNLQQFARDAKRPAVVKEVEVLPPEPTRKSKKVAELLTTRAEIKLVDNYGIAKRLLGAEEGEFMRFISELIHAHGEYHHPTDVIITNDEWVHPSMRYSESRWVRDLTIPIRALAAVKNLDELAAILIRAISSSMPRVYAHRDDPRIMRRLEEQVSFSALHKTESEAIMTDISVIERLRGAGFRPWALTDFDRREGEGSYVSRTYEVRLLAQKIAVTYMQDRENIRDLVRTVHPLPPALKKIHGRAVRHEPLRYAGQLAKKHRRYLYGAAGVAAAGTAIQVPEVFNFLWHPELLVELAKSAGHAGLMLLYAAVSTLGFLGHIAYVAGSYLSDWISTGAIFAYDWALAPLWSYVLGPLFHVTARVLDFLVMDVLWPAASWTAMTIYDWSYVLGGLLGLGLLARIAPSVWSITRDVFQGAGEVGGALFEKADGYRGASQLALVGEFNRVWLRDVFNRHLLPAANGNLTEFDMLSRAANDLERLRVERKKAFRSFELDEKAFNPERDLAILGSVYRAPRDYVTLAHEFWRTFSEAVAAGRLDADQIHRIGRPLLPQLSSDRAFESVLGDLFLDGNQRPKLASFHRTLRERFPRISDDTTESRNAEPWSLQLSEINDTGLRDAAFLGLTRIAAELEDVREHPTATRLHGLWFFLNQRFRHPELIDDVVRESFTYVTQRIFGGEWSPRDANLIFDLWHEVRSERRQNRFDDSWDQWAELPGRIADLRSRALLEGELGKAVAITTWESTTKKSQSPFQLKSKWDFVSNQALRGVTHDVTDLWFTQRLTSLGSIHAITEWIDRDVIARGARLRTLTPVMFSFVLDHPELIKDRADIDALVAHDYFWPVRPLPLGGGLQLVKRAVNAQVRGHAALDEELHESLEKMRDQNKIHYLTNLCEKMHRLIVARMDALSLRPEDYDGLERFWLQLTDRAVTSVTDRLMQELVNIVSPDRLPKLRQLAVTDRRVWERDLHSRLALTQVRSKPSYQRLLKMRVGDPNREQVLEKVIEELQADLPERGLAYVQFLENLSVRINSTYSEAKRISVAKGQVADTAVSDSNLNAIRNVFRAVCKWSKGDQFNFLQFLRGEAKPSARLVAAFPSVGLERVARMYEILPLGARVGILDSMLTHGILKEGDDTKSWTQTLSKHIVGGQKTEAQIVTLQLLTAFLYAIDKIGNEQMTTTILSYLYALPPASTTDPVEVLKLVLELFGATGIKVGQFTYATQILGEAGEKLQSLQSRARVPDRIEIYEDIYDLLGVPVGTPLPFLVLDLLGAASMKYAFMGLDQGNLQKVVVKVFRLDAMNNVDLQFDALEHMGRFLVDNYGPRYGVFKVIIKTARTAVRREGSMPNEIRRSRMARNHIYANRSTEAMRIEAPREDLVNPRMIVAQYAPGVPFDQLPDSEKPVFARSLLELENEILFADERVVRFDPDRHAGNAQMDALAEKRALQPIDFGQILRLTRVQRDRIVKLFALAQIASRVGANPWVLKSFQKLLDLSEEQTLALKSELPRHMKVSTPNHISYYISALAALDAAGFAVTDTTYVDLVRGIIQLKPFEKWAPEANSPRKTFTKLVVTEVGEYLKTFEYDAVLRGKVDAYNAWSRTKSFFTGEEHELIPADPREISLKLVKQLEQDVKCEDGLIQKAE